MVVWNTHVIFYSVYHNNYCTNHKALLWLPYRSACSRENSPLTYSKTLGVYTAVLNCLVTEHSLCLLVYGLVTTYGFQ